MAGFTVVAIQKLKAGPKRREIPDRGMPGLLLIIQTTGAKSWAMRFRRPGGKRKGKLVLGPVDLSDREHELVPVIGQPLTLPEARALCTSIKLQRARGIDVIGERQKQRQERDAENSKTFGLGVLDFIDEYRKDRRQWREVAAMLGLKYPAGDGEPVVAKGGLCDRWRDKPVREIDSDDIYAVISESRRAGIPA